MNGVFAMNLKTKYIPIAIKKQIVNQIIANCITEENELITYDYFNYQLALDLSLIEFYYDGECDDIDKFYEDGSMEELYKIIPESEIDFITNAVSIAIQEKKEINNSVSAVLAKTLNKIALSLPDEKGMQKIINSIPKAINKIDKENLSAITSALGGKKLGE